jgi:cytochrome c peroxidase
MKRFNEAHWMLALSLFLILSALVTSLWQGSQNPLAAGDTTSSQNAEVIRSEPIQPIPLNIELDEGKVALGRVLFHDTRLSHDNTLACVTCHNLRDGGVDHLQFAVGIEGIVGPINTPTVYNSGFNFRQFWDGRAATLEAQVPGPIHNPIEMGSNWDEIIGRLNVTPNYVSAFAELYGDGITAANITDAIATFERSLYTPNSRFDQFLRGDGDALTDNEQQGYILFQTYGCASCHQGVNVGGNMYQRMGIIDDYFTDRGDIVNADLGLFNLTGDEQDRYVFKVPSLRMAALTAPYLHDGTVPTLEGAVEVMVYYQLGRSISSEEVDSIVQFLRTLPGEHPELSPQVSSQ